MIFDKNKKGELTTKQLVIIIIIIVSFIIILFLLFRLNLGETSSKEICHNSVLLKHQTKILSGPLDCRTNYLCISGGGDCDEISATSTIKVKNKNETMKAIADEMSDCWWMFGEGKIDYVREEFSGSVDCALCSVIDFEKIEGSISYSEFFNYLKTTPKSSSQTYLQYLYATDSLDDLEGGDPSYEFDFNKQYVLVTGIAKKGYLFKVVARPYYIIKSLFTDEEKEREEGVFTVIVEEKENIGNLNCTEFITKA